MKDPLKIVQACRQSDNHEPVFVLRGRDAFALSALNVYLGDCILNNCSEEFIDDLLLLIKDFEQFQKEETTKLPD